jgi:hypothetical protein
MLLLTHHRYHWHWHEQTAGFFMLADTLAPRAADEPLLLARDPRNPADPNAVDVLQLRGTILGHISAAEVDMLPHHTTPAVAFAKRRVLNPWGTAEETRLEARTSSMRMCTRIDFDDAILPAGSRLIPAQQRACTCERSVVLGSVGAFEQVLAKPDISALAPSAMPAEFHGMQLSDHLDPEVWAGLSGQVWGEASQR